VYRATATAPGQWSMNSVGGWAGPQERGVHLGAEGVPDQRRGDAKK